MQPLYINSFANAKAIGEIDLWRESHRENIKCKDAIDRMVSARPNGWELPHSIIEDACAEFGIDRVGWVLANTVNESEYDGRYRPGTKLWAKTAYGIPNERWNSEFKLCSHPELVNGLVGQYRQYVQSLENTQSGGITLS